MNRLLLGLLHYPSLALVGALLALCGYAQLATARAERAPVVVIMRATPALAEVAPTAQPTAEPVAQQAAPTPQIVYVDRVVAAPPAESAAPATYAPAQEAPQPDALNDPAQNGGSVAAPGCPFPVVNGVCGNGASAAEADEGAAEEGTHAGRALPGKPQTLDSGIVILPTARP